MDNAVETAVEAFNAGFNCAQSVAMAFSEQVGQDKNMLLKLSAGFGAGMGRKQEVCGAVSGGLMILGLMAGSADSADAAGKEAMYAKVNRFMDRFKLIMGSYTCHILLEGCDLNSDHGKAEFKNRDLRNSVCLRCVREATAIARDLIREA